MANQTLPLDVSYEMNKNETGLEKRDMSVEENLYSSSLDTPEELCSSSVPDTCGVRMLTLEEIAILCGFEGNFARNISTK